MTPSIPDTEAPLVATAWLADPLDAPDLRVFDCTVHLRAQLPGAAFVDLGQDLSYRTSDLRFTPPRPARLAAAFGAAGISSKTTIVLHSSTSPMYRACRCRRA